MIDSSSDLDILARDYLKGWPTVQGELRHSKYGDFFQEWSPDLLTRENPLTIPELWKLMDRVWDEMNIRTKGDLIAYYAHPIWWLNARVEEMDPTSIKHRLWAVKLAGSFDPKKALDRGGGYGLLVRIAHHLLPDTNIHLEDVINIEDVGSELSDLERISVLNKSEPPYDVIWSTEVFEHLIDPLKEVYDVNKLLRLGGGLITSYSFYPMIKCHLPHNFYLRHIFHKIVPLLGFRLVHFERPGVTVWVYEKVNDCGKSRFYLVKCLLSISRPLLEIGNGIYPFIKKGT